MVSDERDRYKKAVDQLLTLADFERKSRANQPPDWHLRRVERLMEMLDDPHLATPVVHVAGSKGKGSTCAMISAGLNAAGFRAGMYTSPHLHTFTERIQVSGENISQTDFADLIENLWPTVEAIEQAGDLGVVSVFEMLTAMAFVHFRGNADIAVIETGLGGRLDATNVVNPEVSVITPISRDHVNILGDKISLIAREKAGIIKPDAPVVVSKNHPVTWQVVRQRASVTGSKVISACETTKVSGARSALTEDMRQEFVIKSWRQPRDWPESPSDDSPSTALNPLPDPGLTDVQVQTKLLGTHQIDNARTATTVFNVLYQQGIPFDVNAAIKGISEAVWPCRTEILDLPTWPRIILDGAHNDASLRALRETITGRLTAPHGNLPYALVVGATAGHDQDAIIGEIAPDAVSTIATQSRHPKSIPAAQIVEAGSEQGLEIRQQPNVEAALNDAAETITHIGGDGIIVVTGSLFVAAEAREHLLGIEPEIYDDLKQPYMVPYQDDESTKDKIA